MFQENNLFYKFDAPTKGFSEMSTLYYGYAGFTFQNTLYLIFSDFVVYVLTHYFSPLFAFISMYILLKKTFGFSSILSVFIAICFAILPVNPGLSIAIGTLPFIMTIFCYFIIENTLYFMENIITPIFSFFL